MKTTKLQQNSSELELRIKEKTGLNKTRVFLIVAMVIGVIKLGRVNLRKLAPLINPLRSRKTNYRRLNKFFQFFTFDILTLSRLMASFLPDGKWVLTMDRTNWKFGKVHINILMLGVAYKGIAIPLIWYLLREKTKSGNSSYRDKIRIMKKFIDIFGVDRIEILTADREFIGKVWFKWLKKRKVPFAIRIMNNVTVKVGRGEIRIDSLFRNLKLGEHTFYRTKKTVYGYKLSIIAVKMKDEYLIVATNMKQELALGYYKKRWEIETLFSALKMRGLNLEETHMCDRKKIHTLVGILAIAFVWCHIIGEWLNKITPIKTLKHGRYAQSLFLYGLEFISDVFLNYEFRNKDLLLVFQKIDSRLIKIGDY